MESQKRYGGWAGEGNDHRPTDLSRNDGRSPITKPGDEQGDRKDLKTCSHCGKQFKNLGSHQRHCGPKEIIIDDFVEKPLSLLISEFEELLKSYIHTINVSVDKENGNFKQITLTARFQARR
jgi:hypothetical protein